ncbi:hypothetical protein EMPG_12973 [Blastomyces silverae]|uniref:Zn(2)-C6 fungal-type domain-containing protein n=1 Tax=Blastomyces silverae TaxID=2060906 RepID=A0A0H1BKP3_9EURO|nr:hypothetical protein EMPG_12973 [Blastomyces silverae]
MAETGNPAPQDVAAHDVSPSRDAAVGLSQTTNRQYPQGNTPIGTCMSCRQSKVRCSQPSPGLPCVRCQRTGRLCIPAAQAAKKRQKQPGSRMMELESRIDALATSIMQSQNPTFSSHTAAGKKEQIKHAPGSDNDGSNDLLASHTPVQQSPDEHDVRTTKSLPGRGLGEWESASIPHSYIDAKISQNINETTAASIFNRYATAMAPNLPFVVFPEGTRAATIRKSKPAVFLAILDVASAGFCEVAAQRKIRRLLVQVYLHYMLRTNEYSLPLLQALIISATWYRPIEPTQPGEQMDVYQLSHTASNMAIIMGLDKQLGSGWSSELILPPGERQSLDDLQRSYIQEWNLAARRVWLGCHYICSNTSMALHSPNVMRWTRYMDECLEVLETSAFSSPSDKLFCQHVKLQHIIEEFELQLAWESPAPAVNSTQESQAGNVHKIFMRQLEDWNNAVPQDCWNEILNFSRHFANLYIKEMAITLTSRRSHSSLDEQPSQKIIISTSAFSTCVDSLHHLFRIIQSLDMSAIRAMPTVYFIRMIYTAIVLIKLHFAAMEQQQTDDTKQHADSDLQVSERLETLIQMFAGWGELWPAARLTMVFKKLKTWFEKHSSSRMTLHELSWLSPWAFGKEGDEASSPSASPDNQHQHRVETPLESDTLSPPSPLSSLAYSQLRAITPTTPATSSPRPFPATVANAVPPVLPDLSSEPLISMDLDLDQIFPDAMQGFDLDFGDLGNNASWLPPEGLAIGGSTADEAPKTDMSSAEWSAIFEGVSPPVINVDVEANVDDVMRGLEFDDRELGRDG